jgi:hypothetical protein
MTLKMKPTKAVHMSASTTNSKQVMLVILVDTLKDATSHDDIQGCIKWSHCKP